MPPSKTKLAQSQLYAEIDGIAGTWAQVGSTTKSSQTTKVRDGGAPNTETLMGHAEFSDMTLSRPFDRARDFASYRQLMSEAGTGRARTLTTFFKDADGTIVDKFTYTCSISSCSSPSGDSMSNSGATLEVVVSIDGFAG